MSAYKEKPVLEDPGIQTVIARVRMSPNGPTKEDRKKLREIYRVHEQVLGQLQNDSSRKLCELTDYHKAKIEESIQLPKLIDRPLVEKAAHFMAESAFGNIRVKNTLQAGKGDREPVVLLLKDLGLKDENISMLDLTNNRISYNEESKAGLIAVSEKGEHKTVEAVVYGRLYELYLQQLRTTLK
ncbi:MAG: hypothetical protein Sv326_0686 [Candidatus Fermentimicrarchaeum limneticum]|uniref:Uncharacterized protein n=1 Tax=Fermentimicrarchaeum limneticum TaxID=2795018 RepID=A0A7D6BT09_FERL1|nr:MAG: hypothetical protein Sv326_0686 [Candidatus Fermentimicrarchaeum limneticum]